MTTITNTTGSKKVTIGRNGGDATSIIAQLIQGDGHEAQVLQTKYYISEKSATKWANKILA